MAYAAKKSKKRSVFMTGTRIWYAYKPGREGPVPRTRFLDKYKSTSHQELGISKVQHEDIWHFPQGSD